MANTKVTTGVIKDDAVGADQLASNSVVTASIVDNAITTAKINDDAILTAKISNSAITNAKMSANSVDSDQYVDGSIDTAHIGDGQITSAKLDTNIAVSGELTVGSHLNMGDGDILKMGASADLQIYHDGSYSYIREVGTGDLRIGGASNVQIWNSDIDSQMANFANGGAVTLYYAGATKLATTSSGIDVTGTVVADGLTVDTSTLVVDATNNRVGIGTTSPSSELHIKGASPAGIFNSQLLVDTTDTTGAEDTGSKILFGYHDGVNNRSGPYIFGANTSGQSAHYSAYLAFGTRENGSNPAERMRIDASGNVDLYQGNNLTWRYAAGSTIRGSISVSSADAMTFSTGSSNTERMRIDTSGNVGIGTDNPTAKLNTQSTVPDTNIRVGYDANKTTRIGTTSGGDAQIYAYETGVGYHNILLAVDSGSAAGNVGIGTDSPATQFHIVNADDAVARIESSGSEATDDARLEIKTTNGTFTIQNDRSLGTSGALTFAGNTSNNLVIDHNSGNVGIATSSPLSKLHVEGDIGQQGTANKSVSNGVGDSGINIITGVHNGYVRGSGRLRVMGTENNQNGGYAEYFYSYSSSSGGTYYINLKFIDESYTLNDYARPRLYLYNSSSYNNNSTNRQNTNQTTSSTNTNIGQIGITNVANALGTFQIVAEPMHWKP